MSSSVNLYTIKDGNIGTNSVFLLDELKGQKGVSRKKYTRQNNSEEEMGEHDGNEK